MPKGIKITPEQFAYRINTLKGQTSATMVYDKEQVIELLKKFDIPASGTYITAYCNHGIIVRVRPGEFKFPGAPVHISKIMDALEERRSYNRKWTKKTKEDEEILKEPSEKPIEEPSEKDTIARCIDYLKQRGYLILKQV
jgi:hypothetical protein